MLWLPGGVLVENVEDPKWHKNVDPTGNEDQPDRDTVVELYRWMEPRAAPALGTRLHDNQKPVPKALITPLTDEEKLADYLWKGLEDDSFEDLYRERGGTGLACTLFHSFCDAVQDARTLSEWRSEMIRLARSHRASAFDAHFINWLLADIVDCEKRVILSMILTVRMQNPKADREVELIQELASDPETLNQFLKSVDKTDSLELLHAILKPAQKETGSKTSGNTGADATQKWRRTIMSVVCGLKDVVMAFEFAKIGRVEGPFSRLTVRRVIDYYLGRKDAADVVFKNLEDVFKSTSSFLGGRRPLLDAAQFLRAPNDDKATKDMFYSDEKVKTRKLIQAMKQLKSPKEKVGLLRRQRELFLHCTGRVRKQIIEEIGNFKKEDIDKLDEELLLAIIELVPDREELQELVLNMIITGGNGKDTA